MAIKPEREVRTFYFLSESFGECELRSFKAAKYPSTWRKVDGWGPDSGTVFPHRALGRQFHETPEAAFQNAVARAELDVKHAQEYLHQLLMARKECLGDAK